MSIFPEPTQTDQHTAKIIIEELSAAIPFFRQKGQDATRQINQWAYALGRSGRTDEEIFEAVREHLISRWPKDPHPTPKSILALCPGKQPGKQRMESSIAHYLQVCENHGWGRDHPEVTPESLEWCFISQSQNPVPDEVLALLEHMGETTLLAVNLKCREQCNRPTETYQRVAMPGDAPETIAPERVDSAF